MKSFNDECEETRLVEEMFQATREQREQRDLIKVGDTVAALFPPITMIVGVVKAIDNDPARTVTILLNKGSVRYPPLSMCRLVLKS